MNLLAAVMTIMSVMSLSLFFLLCLHRRRRRKPKIIHQETQIYNPQVFSRGGSKFAVVRSKTVTRANQMSPNTPGTSENDNNRVSREREEGHYTNEAGMEHIYVAPISVNEYENEDKIRDSSDGVYGNVDPETADDDYENFEFLAKQEGILKKNQESRKQTELNSDDEPDYVNVSE